MIRPGVHFDLLGCLAGRRQATFANALAEETRRSLDYRGKVPFGAGVVRRCECTLHRIWDRGCICRFGHLTWLAQELLQGWEAADGVGASFPRYRVEASAH